MKTRLHNWASAILVIPRWLLTVKYALFALYGVIAAVAGAPTLDKSINSAYAFGWSIVLAVAALIAVYGSVSERYEVFEKWAGVAIVGLMSTILVGAIQLVNLGDINRAGFSVLLFMVTLLPASRAAALILKTTPRDHRLFKRGRK